MVAVPVTADRVVTAAKAGAASAAADTEGQMSAGASSSTPHWVLAQLNISRLLAPVDSPQLAPFVARLAEVKALAEASPGFVWRQRDGEGPGNLANRPFGDDVLVNLSVWRDVESLVAFVYRTAHATVLRRRDEWFHRAVAPMTVLWWVPAGHHPTLDEAGERLAWLRERGPTTAAFSLRQRFPPPSIPGESTRP